MTLKTPLLTIYCWALAAVIGLVVFHAPLTVWLGTFTTQYDLLIKSWKEVLLLLLTPLSLYLAWRGGVLRSLLQERLLQLIAAYALLHLLLAALFRPQLDALMAGLLIDLRYLLFFVLVFVAIRLRPSARKTVLTAGITAAVISIVFGVLQATVLPADILQHIGYSKHTIAPYLTIDQNPNFVRINGTLRGPNPLGAFAVVVLSGALAYMLGQRRYRRLTPKHGLIWALALSSVVVLWATYSRSAAAAAALSCALLLGYAFWRKLRHPAVVAAVGAAMVLSGLALFTFRDSDFVQHVVVHNNPQDTEAFNSNEGHTDSLQEGARRALAQPLGAGPGSTGSASLLSDEPLIIENQYLFTAHESGWLGLGLFMAISVMVLARLWQRRSDWLAVSVLASGLGLMAIGLLLPVWADDTVSLVWWGLAALAVAGRQAPSLPKKA